KSSGTKGVSGACGACAAIGGTEMQIRPSASAVPKRRVNIGWASVMCGPRPRETETPPESIRAAQGVDQVLGRAKTKRLLSVEGWNSGASRRAEPPASEGPVETATYCRPSTSKVTG